MKPTIARRLRQLHRWIGLFFAPAIIFFSVSGAFQTLGWHESRGGGPQPAAWIAWMASIHKDQRLPGPPHEHAHPDGDDHDHHADEHDGPGGQEEGPSSVPMKAFVLCLSLGLIASSLMGVVIALTSPGQRRGAWLTLMLGAVVPAALLFL